VEAWTYFSGAGHFLKNQRTLTLDKDLPVVP
jgi:hypothetical protein